MTPKSATRSGILLNVPGCGYTRCHPSDPRILKWRRWNTRPRNRHQVNIRYHESQRITTTPMCWQVAKLLQTLISGSVSCVVPTNEYVKDELKPACWTFVIVSLVFWRRNSRTWQPKGGSTAEQLRKAAEVAAAAGSDAVNASEVWSVVPYVSWKHRERRKEQPKGWCFLARLAYYQHLICMEITCSSGSIESKERLWPSFAEKLCYMIHLSSQSSGWSSTDLCGPLISLPWGKVWRMKVYKLNLWQRCLT